MIKSIVSKQGDLDMARTPERAEQQYKWEVENMRKYMLKITKSVDSDIYELLENSSNKQGLIKQALREYIANHKEQG